MKLFRQVKFGIDRLKLFSRFIRFKPSSMIPILLMIVMFVSLFTGLLRNTNDIKSVQQVEENPQLEQSHSQQLLHASAEAWLSSHQLQTELVLMVSIPGFSFLEMSPESMQWMPTLQQLSEVGKLAALNIRTPERGIEDVYLTINAGAPAIAPSEAAGYQQTDDVTDNTDTDDIAAPPEASSPSSYTFDADIMVSTLLDKHVHIQGKDQISRILLDSYTRYTGNLITSNQIVVPNIGYLTTLNKSQTYDARIGRLGDELQANGVRTAVFANRQATEDTATGSAPLMLMNSEGIVAEGNLSDEMLIYDSSSPGNVRTDTARLVRAVQDFIRGGMATGSVNQVMTPSVILIEYGDWHRLDQERRYYDEKQWQDVRRRELNKLDRFLAELVAITDDASNGQLWIWSPQPHSQATKAKLHVTPFIQYEGSGLVEQYRSYGIEILERKGLLSSPTTKRPGLISLHDLGPTLLASLAVDENEDWTGFPLTTATTSDSLRELMTDVGKMQHVYELRTTVVIPFVFIESVVLLLSLLFVLLKRRKALNWMRLPLFSLLIAPLVILLLGFVPQFDPQTQLIILLATVIVLSFISILFTTWKSILFISALTSVVLLVDGILGAPLLRYSIMGYDPMIGARYYGIGNEYMGVLVGSAILACALAVQHWTGYRIQQDITSSNHLPAILTTEREMLTDRPEQLEDRERPTRRQVRRRNRFSRRIMATVTLVWFLAITFYMAAPGGGTNAGGALTASVAFGITWLSIFGGARLRRVNIWRLVGAGLALLAAGLVVLWVLNQWLTPSDDLGSKSHIGRAMDLLVNGRLDVIFGMIVRKLQMNLHLIGVSSWGKVLLTSIFVMAVLLLKPRGMLNEWQETRPYWMSGFTAIIIGAIVALALNDSGIVAAGTMIVFAAAPMLLLISEQMPSRAMSQLSRSRTDR